MIEIPMTLDPGAFYRIGNYHVLPFQTLPVGTTYDLDPVDVACVFNIHKIKANGTSIALAFSSPYRIINEGGYILTLSTKGYNLANYTTTIRDEKIVIYNYDDAALAISPSVNPYVEAFFKEQ